MSVKHHVRERSCISKSSCSSWNSYWGSCGKITLESKSYYIFLGKLVTWSLASRPVGSCQCCGLVRWKGWVIAVPHGPVHLPSVLLLWLFFVIVVVLWGFLFVHFSGVVDVKSGCCQCFILKRLCFPQQLLCLYQSILLLSKWPCLEKNGGGSSPVTAQIMKFAFASCAAANEEVQAGRWVCAGAPWPCSDALEVRSAEICQCQPNSNYWLFFRSLNETSFSQRVLPWIVLSCEPVLWGLGTSVKKLSEIKIGSLSSWEV